MKIVLTTGFVLKKGRINLNKQCYYPPLGLGYIASVLEKKGYNVKIYDCLPLNYSVDKIVDDILKHNPDIIGISVMSTSYEAAKKIAHFVKKNVDIPVIFGGPHCSSFPVKTVEECQDIDFLIYGEGEFIFPILIEALSCNLSYDGIPQLCYRDPNGRVILNKKELLVENLDTLPFPAWHLFNRNLYAEHGIPCITSRGCSYSKCAFCMRTGLLYEKYRRRSVENVITELESLKRMFSYNGVIFFDDNFAQDEQWVIEFCDTLIQKKILFKWFCQARVDTITKKMIKKMAEAGCSLIAYGIETASQKLLDYLKKGITIEQVRDAIRFTKEQGIETSGYFMVAIPKETPEIGRQTVQFAIDLDLDYVQFVPTRPLFGTKLYELCEREGTIIDNSYEYYHTSFASSAILMPKVMFIPHAYRDKKAVNQIIRFAYIKFSCRPHYILKSLRRLKGNINIVKIIENLLMFIRIIVGI